MRLNKYIARSGVCSRRKADELIENGNVKINGQVFRQVGYQLLPDDQVVVNGIPIALESKKVYLMFHKPKGVITTAKDEQGRTTIFSYLTDVPQRVFPIGRLDGDTTGLLLLTNDGDFAQRLAHPRYKIGKTYEAKIAGDLSFKKIAQLERGVDIGGYVTGPARVSLVKKGEKSTVAQITVYEGKNRQVRKMFRAVGHPVWELKRIAIGNLSLARLKEGHYRKLTPKEIQGLLALGAGEDTVEE